MFPRSGYYSVILVRRWVTQTTPPRHRIVELFRYISYTPIIGSLMALRSSFTPWDDNFLDLLCAGA